MYTSKDLLTKLFSAQTQTCTYLQECPVNQSLSFPLDSASQASLGSDGILILLGLLVLFSLQRTKAHTLTHQKNHSLQPHCIFFAYLQCNLNKFYKLCRRRNNPANLVEDIIQLNMHTIIFLAILEASVGIDVLTVVCIQKHQQQHLSNKTRLERKNERDLGHDHKYST